MPSAKPVVITVESNDGKRKTMHQGRWSAEEHEKFVKNYQLHGRKWKLLAKVITTRTVLQIRTHAQKYFNKLSRNAQKAEVNAENSTSKSSARRRNAKGNSVKTSRRTQRKGLKSLGANGSVRKLETKQSRTSPKSSAKQGPQRNKSPKSLFREWGSNQKRKASSEFMGLSRKKQVPDGKMFSEFPQVCNVLMEPWDTKFDASAFPNDMTRESKLPLPVPSTPPQHKFGPLIDIGSPVALTDLNDFLLSPQMLEHHQDSETSLNEDSSWLADVDASTESSLPDLYKRSTHSFLPLRSDDDVGVELDIHTLARMSEQGSQSELLFMPSNIWS